MFFLLHVFVHLITEHGSLSDYLEAIGRRENFVCVQVYNAVDDFSGLRFRCHAQVALDVCRVL